MGVHVGRSSLLAAAALALTAGLASAPPAHAPISPQSPSYEGVPGALPPSLAYVYDDAAGPRWPVRVTTSQHPMRGGFLDPRGTDDDALAGYHFGVDVNVDDRHPDPGAPPTMSHAVYALESGSAQVRPADARVRCINRRLDVGHFSYWHVSPIVRNGQHVRAGQQIGWTCLHVWHVHISEWQQFRGVRVWVNPLHRGGRLRPYVDAAPPVVSALRFVTPPRTPWHPRKSLSEPDTSQPLDVNGLHGLVEVRAQIGDPQSFFGFLAQDPAWPTEFSPYRVAISIADARTGRTILARTTFQADQLPQTPYLDHYAPGSVEVENMTECVAKHEPGACGGTYWFRPLSRFRQEFWDTRTVRNGDYRVTVRAWDLAGNVGSLTVPVRVKN